jgi:16S rRNA G966 N2-methylase RsmD
MACWLCGNSVHISEKPKTLVMNQLDLKSLCPTDGLTIEQAEKWQLKLDKYLAKNGKEPGAEYLKKMRYEIGMERARNKVMALAQGATKHLPKAYQNIADQYAASGIYDTEYAKEPQYGSFDALTNYLTAAHKKEQLVSLHCCDLVNAPIADASVDVIITDPPYPKEFLHTYRDLAVLANRVLKPGGSLLAMAGQSYLPDIMQLMDVEGDLHYHWTVSYLTPGGQSPQIWQRKVNTFWKPVLWYVKGKYERHWVGDVSKSNVNDNDKRFHFWGQSESGIKDLVDRFSRPGEVVLDPFLGGGTTGIVCKMYHRRFVGVEIDAQVFAQAQERIAAAEMER